MWRAVRDPAWAEMSLGTGDEAFEEARGRGGPRSPPVLLRCAAAGGRVPAGPTPPMPRTFWGLLPPAEREGPLSSDR